MRSAILAFGISLFCLCLTTTNTGCPGGVNPAPIVVAVDCLVQNGTAIDNLVTDFGKHIVNGTPDWATIEAEAESAGLQIGGCALSEYVQQYLTAKAAGSATIDQSWLAHDTLEHFRSKLANGASFKTKLGNL